MLSLRTIRRPSTGLFQIAVRTVFPFHVTSRGRPTFTESNRGIRISSKSRLWQESVLYSHDELSVRDSHVLLAQRGHRGARIPLANPALPKHFPPHTNQFQANRVGGPCAPTIRRRVLQF